MVPEYLRDIFTLTSSYSCICELTVRAFLQSRVAGLPGLTVSRLTVSSQGRPGQSNKSCTTNGFKPVYSHVSIRNTVWLP